MIHSTIELRHVISNDDDHTAEPTIAGTRCRLCYGPIEPAGEDRAGPRWREQLTNRDETGRVRE